MTQDLYYYETGYVDESYFVYTADAEGTESSSFSMNATVGVIRQASVGLSSSFTQSATVSHIEGADLFAFSNTQLAAQVAAIRDNNVAVTSAFAQITSGARVRYVSSDQFIDSAISADNLRVRFSEAASTAAFSLVAELTLEPGVTVQASGTWSSDFVIDAKGSRKQNLIDCDISAQFTQDATGDRIRGLTSTLFESSVFEVTQISIIKQGSADLTGNFSQTTINSRTRDFASAENALFSPGLTVTVFRNSFAVLDSVATVNATTAVNKPFTSSMASAVSLTASVSIIRKASGEFASNFTNSITGSIVGKRPRLLTAVTAGTGSLSYNSSDKILGTHSLQVVSTSAANRAYYRSEETKDFRIAANETFIVEFYFKPTAVSTTGTWANLVSAQPSGLANPYWSIQLGGISPRTINFAYLITFDNGTSQLNRLSANLIGTDYEVNQWHYVSVSRLNGTVNLKFARKNVSTGVWTLPTVVATESGNTVPFGPTDAQTGVWDPTPNLYVGDPSDKRSSFLIDELYMARGTATSQQFKDGTNPTLNVSGGEPETQFLFHWDNNTVDDMTGVKEFYATLQSTASTSAIVGVTAQGAASIQTTAIVGASLNKIYQGVAAIQSNGFVAAAIGRIRPFVDIEVSTFTATINGSVIRSGSISASASASVNAIPTKNIGPIIADLTSAASQTTIGNVVTGNSASLSVDGFLLSAFGRIRPEIADLTSAFSMAALVEAGKIASADLAATASMSTVVTKNIGPITATLSTSSTLVTQGNAIPGGSIVMTANSSMNIVGDRIRYASSAVTANTSVYADGDIVRLLSGNLSSTTVLSVNAYRIKQLSATFDTIATEINVVNKIGSTFIDCPVTSTLSAQARVLAATSSAMDVNSTLVSSSRVNKPYASIMNMVTTLVAQAEAGIIAECDATVTSTMTVNAIVKSSASANMLANFTQVANNGAVRNVIALEMTFADMQVTGNIIKSTSSNPGVTSSLSIVAGKVQTLSADLHCEGFILSDGTVINLAASAIWVVPPEIRLWTVAQEIRDYIVEFEQRDYKIKG